MRKLISLLLALSMLLSLTGAVMAEEVYTLDYYWVGNGDNAVRAEVEEAINAYIEPLIGANVRFHIVGWNDWTEKAVNALQSGEKMDIIFTADWREYMVEVSGGLLTPLNDLLQEYGKGILETLPATFIEGTQVNGINYAVPTNKELCVPEGVVVNVTAAKEIGWDVTIDDPSIQTLEDLEPWLEKYKELHPDKYPYLMDGSGGRWPDEPWAPDWAGMESNCIAMRMALNEDGTADETIYSIFETEEQEEHIRLMYKWGQAGYISPDASLTSFDYNGIFGAGDFLCMALPLKGSNIKGAEMYLANHTTEFEYTEITMQPKYVVTTHSGGSMLGIPVTCKQPGKAMEYINLMHTDPTLINMMLYGVEGKQWEKTEDGFARLMDNSWYGAHGGAWTIGNTALQMVTETEDPQKNELLQAYAADAIPTPSLGFRFVKDNVANQVSAVTAVIKEYANPLSCGVVDPDDPAQGIEALRTALKDAGIDEILTEVQAQYDEWKAAKAQ